MATALAKGIADSKLRAPADICGSDRVRALCRIRRASRIKLTATTHRAAQSPEMRAKFANAVGKRCFVTESNVELAKKSNVIFLSVKPSIVPVRARALPQPVHRRQRHLLTVHLQHRLFSAKSRTW